MAESAVSFAIAKLAPLLTQEVKLLKGIHKEVADIKDGLEIIRAFLKDADSKVEKEGTSEGVKVWIKQAREEAFRIGDIIDEYMLHVAIHHDQSGFMSFVCRIASLVMELKPRYEIASEIQNIKTSVKEIKDRSERFHFISSEQGASSSHASERISHDPRLGAYFIEEDEVVGIESSRNELINYLVDGGTQRTVISVVGMGGMGKTTFAKKVYDNNRVKKHFGCHVWITVSQSYDKKVLPRTMLKEFFELKNKPFPENIFSMEELLLIDELRKCLIPERYFVVFDDVWEVNFWEDVEHALLENCSGSRILITTRNEDVANFCKRSSMIHVHQMKPLPRQLAWKLFCQKALKFEFDGQCPNDLEELSLAIVERCGGLPLAIVAIGGLLAMKQKVAFEWKRFLDSLGSALMSNPHLENVIKILSLSYDDLPYHLKSCFLYFGMFPEDFLIGHGKLIRSWVAEGFVQEKQGLTSEEVAEEYLTELI